jgi:hypothetical protein
MAGSLLSGIDKKLLKMCIYNKEETHSKRAKKEDPQKGSSLEKLVE